MRVHFLFEATSNYFAHNEAIFFLTIYFIAPDFIALSDLNSNLNNLIQILSIRVFLVN